MRDGNPVRCKVFLRREEALEAVGLSDRRPDMTHADVDALRRGYEALNRGDLSVVLELLDEDIEWHQPDPSPEAGTHHGRDSFERFFRGWIESFDEFRIEPEQVVERGPGAHHRGSPNKRALQRSPDRRAPGAHFGPSSKGGRSAGNPWPPPEQALKVSQTWLVRHRRLARPDSPAPFPSRLVARAQVDLDCVVLGADGDREPVTSDTTAPSHGPPSICSPIGSPGAIAFEPSM